MDRPPPPPPLPPKTEELSFRGQAKQTEVVFKVTGHKCDSHARFEKNIFLRPIWVMKSFGRQPILKVFEIATDFCF